MASYFYDQEAVEKAFPAETFQNMWLEALDHLEEPLLVVTRDLTVCYINENYIKTYGKELERLGLTLEDGHSWKLTDVGTIKDSAEIIDVLNGKEYAPKYYSTMQELGISSFTDIVPLQVGGEIYGALVIIRKVTDVEKMTAEIYRYRALAGQLQQELLAKESLPVEFRQIIGTSPAFVKLLHTAARVAKSEASVCLFGESGTGKEVLSTAIHFSSKRAEGPLVKINCAAIPESLMESELFGYESGAFTGAKKNGSPGKLELADGGTLFLDEIGEMPLSMQVKLLRALQEKEITRVGGSQPIKLNFRLITATNRKLEDMVKEGTFREDLFYRINVIPLVIPPLRERKSDIPTLVQFFLEQLNEQYNEEKVITERALHSLMEYDWPGNIRELKNVVERMDVLAAEDEITEEWLPEQIQHISGTEGSTKERKNYSLQKILDETEKDTIRAVLNLTEGNRSKAIEMLGISRRNFYLKLEKHHIR